MHKKIRISIVNTIIIATCLLFFNKLECKAYDSNLIENQEKQLIEEQKNIPKVTRKEERMPKVCNSKNEYTSNATKPNIEEDNVEEIEFSEEEINLLKKATFAEGGICSQDVQQAIAATIIERAKENNQTIQEVIFDKGQFSCVVDQKVCINIKNEPTPVTDEMAEQVAEAVELAISEGAGKVAEELKKVAIEKGLDVEVYGGDPLYFYSPAACSQDQLEIRSSIQVTYSEDGVTFYRVWE